MDEEHSAMEGPRNEADVSVTVLRELLLLFLERKLGE
jgi:hypothetical protein